MISTNVKRIYFTGAHSVGKSTLARHTSKHYSIPLLSEVARLVLAEQELRLDSLRVNLDTVDFYQEEVFARQLKQEQKYEKFVSDRSFDFLAYAAQHSRILPKLIANPELSEYLNSLKDPSTRIFFVRPSRATLKDDGVRESLTWDGIVSIDAMVKFVFELYDIPHIQINTDSMQERTRLIDSVLRY